MASILNLDFSKAALDLWIKGGWVMYPIYGLGLIAWILATAKIVQLWQWRSELRTFRKDHTLKGNGLFSIATRDLLAKAGPLGHKDYHQFEWEIQMVHSLNKHIDSIGRIASVSPLVGLLGTVAGLILTFEILQSNAFVNASQLSEGVSEALVATQSGLLTAFPLMLIHQQITSWAEKLEQLTKAEWTKRRETEEAKDLS